MPDQLSDLNDNTSIKKKQDFYLISPELKFAMAGEGNKTRTFKGLAYSGGVITDHWFWKNVIFDLAGMSFVPERMPVLKEHDSEQILGYTTSFTKNGGIEVEGVFLDSSPEAQQVVAMADEGYPWQLSVHIVPDEIEKVHPNQEVTINGLNLIGPGHIFRKSSIREVSFCAVGADRGTNAVVFNIGGTPPKPNKPDIKEGVKMNLNDSGPVDRDLALKTLNDEKNNLAVKCSQLETEKASLIADAAELRNVKKSLEFELQTVKDSLARSQAEAQTLRDEKVTFTKASREAILVEDYKRLGVTFDAKNPEMAAVLVADEPVFQAFRLTLGAIQKAPVSPPEGAFKSVVPQLPDDMDTKFSLAELAKSRRKANNVEVN